MNLSDLHSFSYVPYSNEGSVAIVESQDGYYFPGVRIENISYPLTIDAVQNALFCCISEGSKPQKLFTDIETYSLSYWTDENEIEICALKSLGGVSLQSVLQNPNSRPIPERLHQLLDHARADYSDFPVAALLETDRGLVSGVNIESRDWSRGLCAERVALAKALSYGITDINALHITTRHGEYNSPCGACRQVILEHLPYHPVYLYHTDGTKVMHYSSDLLPYSFQSTKLQDKQKQ